MSLRGRPSLSGTPGRSSLQPSEPRVDLAQLRLLLLSARDLPCFQTRVECQGMIDDVLTSCLPLAAMTAESPPSAGLESGTHSDGAATGLPLPPNYSDMAVDSTEWDTPPYPKQLQLGSRLSSSGRGGSGRGGGGGIGETSSRASFGRRASGSGLAEKIGITRIPDRAWTIALDYLELGEGMRCRQLGRAFRDTVEASLSVLALSGVNSITWATPENLAFLTRFKNVRTLHWYVGVGMPSAEESDMTAASDAAALAGGTAAAAGGGAGGAGVDGVAIAQAAAAAVAAGVGAEIVGAAAGVGVGAANGGGGGGGGGGGSGGAGGSFGASMGDNALRVADCCPVRAWAFLLGALPKIEEVIIVEGAETDERALEEVWLHLLPLCRNLRSFFLNFEDYSQCPVDGDHPPINVKKFAVCLQAKKPFPKLRELHLELGSMSIAEQRSLIRGLSMSGLLPQLEKVTLGDGTTSYVRSPGRGPGRDLYAAFKKNTCSKLKVLWLQRLDLWDDLEALASALAPAHCPVLEELFLDLALDIDDVERLAKCLHKFPGCLKTLGVLAVAIKDRTPDGHFGVADPKPTLQLLADALSKHPRPNLQCLDISLHYEPDPNEAQPGEPPQEPEFKASTAVIPIMSLLESGKLTGLKHVQLSSCSLDDKGLLMACSSVASMKGIQTLDLSGNRLSEAGATELAKALCRCRSLHEIVLEESVDAKDAPAVGIVFKEFMPWATVRVEDRDSRKNTMSRRSLAAGAAGGDGEFFDADEDDQVDFSDEEEGDDDSQNSDGGGADTNHWDAVDAESDGEVPVELMMDDSDDEDAM